jgi:hypothetical protein
MKDVQATGEAFSPLQRKPQEQQNMKLFQFFLLLWVIFALLDPDPDPDAQKHVDQYPQHCRKATRPKQCRPANIFHKFNLSCYLNLKEATKWQYLTETK